MPVVCRRATGFLITVFAVAGCAGQPAPAPVSVAAPPAYATILTVRPLSSAGGTDARASILGALGGIGSASADMTSVEFIVRADDASQPISIVQPNSQALRVGERVILIRGPRPQLARAAGAAL